MDTSPFFTREEKSFLTKFESASNHVMPRTVEIILPSLNNFQVLVIPV